MNDVITGLNAAMDLKLYLQIAIPAGYMGYLLSRLGVGNQDTTTNIVFISLLFALFSVLAWVFTEGAHLVVQVASSISAPALAAILWRKYLHGRVLWMMRYLRIANSVPFPDTWTEIIQNTQVGVAALTVYLKNGDALQCDYIYSFTEAPLDLLRWDHHGNVALYVTDRKLKGESKFSPAIPSAKNTVDGMDFFRLTYIPKDEISTIEVVTNKPGF